MKGIVALIVLFSFSIATALAYSDVARGRHILEFDGNDMLHQLSSPTVGADGKVYACIDEALSVYNVNGTVAWTARLNDTCQILVAPVVDQDGTVYVAANQTVIAATFLEDEFIVSVIYLYNHTNNYGGLLGSEEVTGLALSVNDTAILINAGTAGLYALGVDGTPLWSTNGDFNKSTLITGFEDETFCNRNSPECYFHLSPAVDLCDGTIYIVHANGWLYAIADMEPYVKWRYHLNFAGNRTIAGVTAGNNGRVYVAAVIGILYAFDAGTGTLLWQVNVGPLTVRTCFPRVDNSGRVYVGSLDGFLYAVSPDGSALKRYLSESAANSVIQSCPYLDCSGEAIFTAQVNLKSKITTTSDGISEVSYDEAAGVTIYMLEPTTGFVIWSNFFSGEKPDEQNGYMLDTSLLLATFATSMNIYPAFGKMINFILKSIYIGLSSLYILDFVKFST